VTAKRANAIQKRKSDAHVKGKKQSEFHREMLSSELATASQKRDLWVYNRQVCEHQHNAQKCSKP